MPNSPVDNFYKNLPQYQEELDILLNPNIKRRGRKRKNKMYFTPIAEKATISAGICPHIPTCSIPFIIAGYFGLFIN